MERSGITRKVCESKRNQQTRRSVTLAIIARLTENKEVATALQEQLDHGIYIDLASVLAWQEWINEELNNKDD